MSDKTVLTVGSQMVADRQRPQHAANTQLLRHSPTAPSMESSKPWLWYDSVGQLPAVYAQVWQFVRLNDNHSLCDTNRVYATFLASGLPQTALAHVWSTVNVSIPGQLTRQELFLALSLIALIQRNCPNPVEQLARLDSPPVPYLQFVSGAAVQPSPQQSALIQTPLGPQRSATPVEINQFERHKNRASNNVESAKVVVKPNYNISDDDNDDDFSDFKSAEFTDFRSQSTFIAPIITAPLIPNRNEIKFNGIEFASVGVEQNFVNSEKSHKTNISKNFVPKVAPKTSLNDALIANLSAIAVKHLDTHEQRSTSVENGEDSSFFATNWSLAQSVPTAETPAEQTSTSGDKYSALREIFVDDSMAKGDDFGDFLSHSTTNCEFEAVDSLQFANQDSNDSDSIESIRQQTMHCCRQLIHKAFNVLIVNHGEDSVIEAIATADGKEFALNLLKVYYIAKRIWRNSMSTDSLAKLMDDIEKAWNAVNAVFAKASLEIEFIDELTATVDEQERSLCAICWAKSSAEHSLIPFAGYEYHCSCANLWLNCIHSTLPKPLNHCH